MRHLLSIVISLVSAPIIYLATGFGMAKWAEAGATGGDTDPVLQAVAGFVVAAGVLGALLISRLSPVGPALAGVAFLGVGFWAVYDGPSFRDVFNFSLLDEDAIDTAAILVAPLIGLALLGTLFHVNRWRAKAPAGAGVDSLSPGEPGYQASLYQPAPYPPPQQPSAYAQQYGTYGSSYGTPYGGSTPDPVSPPSAPAETRVETPPTTVLTPPASSWPPPDNNPTLPSSPGPSTPSSGQPGSSWPQPPSAPSWTQPPSGQSWSAAPTSPPPDQEPWGTPPTERIQTDRPWGDPPR
jgi:hypothetical protein